MDNMFSRRRFLQTSGLAAAGVLASGAGIPRVHAGEDNTIKIAWVGCGNRGGGEVWKGGKGTMNVQIKTDTVFH